MLPKSVLLDITVNLECVADIYGISIFNEFLCIVPCYRALSSSTLLDDLCVRRECPTIYLLPSIVDPFLIFRLNCLKTQTMRLTGLAFERLLDFDMLATAGGIVSVLHR